ncbi:primosomal protein N' [Promicromonospora sukumoe]|uniref:Probable replication restart protein PriA n=1 Tax=Promicromonospora sukumoe TaxID=88382 RepID=A0A7W3J809_9MICO|nr:primosomal protein N' [Promicromonospora sukumoe]MBA8807982.1 primosomal protein N' (replication factor Y) [Promicromonospora sukumoe]
MNGDMAVEDGVAKGDIAVGDTADDGIAEDGALLGLDEVGGAPAAQGNKHGNSRGKKSSRGPLDNAETNGIPITEHLPVARVVLDLQPAHLDQPYDYLVPVSMADEAQPGVRIKARFGRQDVGGYVVARQETSDHDGRLVPLRRVVSGEQVLTPEVLALCRAVADRYAGTLADVLRLALPPRHARVEKEAEKEPAPEAAEVSADDGPTAVAADGAAADDGPAADVPAAEFAPAPSSSAWAPYRGGEAYLRRIASGEAPRAVWSALPGVGVDAGEGTGEDTDKDTAAGTPHWAAAVAQAVRSCTAGGRGVLVVVPDARDVERVTAALEGAGAAPDDVVRLLADDGPAPRYRAFLRALRGAARVVVGTRAAMFAPVADLGLVVLWGDGEETLAEPHAPYPHARDVLALRAEHEGAAFLLGSPGRTVQAQGLLASGWARELAAPRDVVRARAPRVRALTSVELAREGAAAAARLPSAAWRAAREALDRGPVLVQVPRSGYLPVVACSRCRVAARCSHCHGPLGLPHADGAPQCTWCGRLAGGWRCEECGWTGLRSVRVGSARTAEELGRAFTGVPVRLSAASAPGGVIDAVPGTPALIVATPGAEPVAEGGYAIALLLDAAVMTGGTGLAAGTEALHRWLSAAGLVRPGPGGQVLLVGDGAPGPTQALVRFDPAGFAERELDERAELHLPPAVRVAAVTGDRPAVDAVVGRVGLREDLGAGSGVLGPVELDPETPGRGSGGRGPGGRGTAAPSGRRGGPGNGAGSGRSSGGSGRSSGGGSGGSSAISFQALDLPVRTVLRVPLAQGDELARRLKASLAVRSARREGGTVRVQLDPKEML